MWYVVIFGMQDTSQIVTQFFPLSSHSVAHSCDLANFKLDCCYEILQQLICICMSTKTSVKFQTIYHTISSIRLNIILIRKQNMTSLSVDTAGVLWVEGRGQTAHDVMLLESQEFKLVCKWIRSSDGDLTNVLFGHSHIIIHWLQVTMGKRCPFCVNCQNIQNKVLT